MTRGGNDTAGAGSHTQGRPPITAASIRHRVAATCEDDAEVALVERAISTLDTRRQQVLALSLWEGFTHQEIAERLDIPLGAVKTWVRRGLINIRDVLLVPATSAAVEPLSG